MNKDQESLNWHGECPPILDLERSDLEVRISFNESIELHLVFDLNVVG